MPIAQVYCTFFVIFIQIAIFFKKHTSKYKHATITFLILSGCFIFHKKNEVFQNQYFQLIWSHYQKLNINVQESKNGLNLLTPIVLDMLYQKHNFSSKLVMEAQKMK